MINSISIKKNQAILAPAGILLSAFIYGIIWIPYRALDNVGISGIIATLLTDIIALIFGCLLLIKPLKNILKNKLFTVDKYLFLLMISSGWANLGCVLGIVEGHVVRVMLLFYLSPVWTMLFARFLLKEKLNGLGYALISLSVLGAMIMLYKPNAGLPLPSNNAEWYGLTAGIAFAYSNVLSRKIQNCPVEIKSLTIWIGVVILASLGLIITQADGVNFESLFSIQNWSIIIISGIAIAIASLSLQTGLAIVPANQASMILLCELVFTALSSYLIANELMTFKEWIGGSLIVSVSFFMNKLEK